MDSWNKCIKCDHSMIAGVCDIDTCKCICEPVFMPGAERGYGDSKE